MTAKRLPLPGSGPDLSADLRQWAGSPIWDSLVSAFGGDPAGMPDGLLDRLAWLDDFSDRWDLRRGRERDQVGEAELTADQDAAIQDAIVALGLLSPDPPRFDRYDHVIALGGLIQACFSRPAYAAHLIASGTASTGSFIALGGHRPFTPTEHELAAEAGLGGLQDEYAALDAGTRAAFHLAGAATESGETSSSIGGSWTLREYDSDGLAVRVAAAPSSEPGARRANTPDSYRWLAEDLFHLTPGTRILAVTTALYVPAQHAAAVRMLGLPYGVVVDTVGLDRAAVPNRWQQSFSLTRHLMELRSAIRGMHALAVDLVPAG